MGRRVVEEKKGMSFFFQAEDGIRGLVRSRGLGDVYKGQEWVVCGCEHECGRCEGVGMRVGGVSCHLHTSDAADE